MAQNITLLGASYSAVPGVTLPKTGGGTATFYDVSDTTAAASDVATGKYFYTASGVKTEGTQEDKAKAFIAEIYAMNRRMGIPEKFDFIKDEDIPQMTKWAYKEANPIYPVPVLFDEEKYASVIGKIRA